MKPREDTLIVVGLVLAFAAGFWLGMIHGARLERRGVEARP